MAAVGWGGIGGWGVDGWNFASLQADDATPSALVLAGFTPVAYPTEITQAGAPGALVLVGFTPVAYPAKVTQASAPGGLVLETLPVELRASSLVYAGSAAGFVLAGLTPVTFWVVPAAERTTVVRVERRMSIAQRANRTARAR